MHEKSCEEELEILKEKYEKLKQKYGLPEFKELDEEFEISKIGSYSETTLRDIRKAMCEKLSLTLNLIELLLNPANGSMFYMYLIRWINGKEKEKLNNLFEKLGEIEIDSLELEVNYSEEKEANFINANLKKWKEIKPNLAEVISSFKDNWKKSVTKKEKSYFG